MEESRAFLQPLREDREGLLRKRLLAAIDHVKSYDFVDKNKVSKLNSPYLFRVTRPHITFSSGNPVKTTAKNTRFLAQSLPRYLKRRVKIVEY